MEYTRLTVICTSILAWSTQINKLELQFPYLTLFFQGDLL